MSALALCRCMLVQGCRVRADLQYVLCSVIMGTKPNSVAVLNFRRGEQDAVASHDLQDRNFVRMARAEDVM